MGARHGVIANAFRRAAMMEQRGGCPRAECPSCGRDCAVYWPTEGDGSVRITFWHKQSDGKWCRDFVDVADIRDAAKAAARG